MMRSRLTIWIYHLFGVICGLLRLQEVDVTCEQLLSFDGTSPRTFFRIRIRSRVASHSNFQVLRTMKEYFEISF